MPRMKWIEWAFGIAIKTWFNIEKVLDSRPFTDQKEETGFYKKLAPRYIGLIDYFILLYKSVVFQPDDDLVRNEYWHRELKNCRAFISVCKTGCRYYEQQGIATDSELQNTQRSPVFGITINHRNLTITSYSHLLGRIIALKKYMQYIQEKKL